MDNIDIKPLRDTVLVSDMKIGERISKGGIHLLNDNRKQDGIRPRWAKVYAVGPDVKDLKAGQWILIEHGRWSRGLEVTEDLTVWKAEYPKSVLLVSDQEPFDEQVVSTL